MSPEEAYNEAHKTEDALNDVIDNQQAEIADLKAQISKHDQDWDKWKQQIAVYEEMLKAKDAKIAEMMVDFAKRLEWEEVQFKRCAEQVKAWKDKAIEERAVQNCGLDEGDILEIRTFWIAELDTDDKAKARDTAARELEEEMNKK